MLQLFFASILQVLLIGVLVGAGLPAIFAAGIRALAYGQGGDAEINHEKPHPIGRVIAYLCFAIVIGVIGMGIAIVVSSGFGYHVSFEHVFPTFHKK